MSEIDDIVAIGLDTTEIDKAIAAYFSVPVEHVTGLRKVVAEKDAEIARLRAALEAEASEGERRGWLAAVDALNEMAKAMDEKAETFRSPNPFDPATTEEADAATTGWALEQAAKLLRERAPIPEAPARGGE